MKFKLTLFVLLFVSLNLFAQQADSTDDSSIYVNSLIKGKMFYYTELAHKLLLYDHVAWISSDSAMKEPQEVMMKLGKEWFCYFKDSLWYAVYGKLEGDEYKVVLHYYYDYKTNRILKVTNSKYDTLMFLSYAKAINNSQNEMIRDSIRVGINYNQYVFNDSLNRINVLIFPAFQHDGKAVYGCEFWYIFDTNGKELIERRVYNGILRYYMPDKTKEIEIEYREFESPPLGAVFYAMYYRNYFKTISIITKNMYHRMIDGLWVSAVLSK